MLALELADIVDENADPVMVTATVEGTPPGGPIRLLVSVEPEALATSADFWLSSQRTLHIAAGAAASRNTVSINMRDDSIREPTEMLQVSAAVSGLPGLQPPAPRTLAIRDDENNPELRVVLSSATIGENHGSSTVTAALIAPVQADVRLTIAVAPGTASTQDYQVSDNLLLTIAALETESDGLVTVTALDDDLDEPPETVTVSATVESAIALAAPAARTLTIVEGEATPNLELVLEPERIDEAGETNAATVTARLAHGSAEATIIKIAATAHDPDSGAYFTVSDNKMLTIAAGDTESSGLVTVTAVADTVDGPNKVVRVAAEMVSGGLEVKEPDARFLTIVDDDRLPTLTLALNPATVGEDGGVTEVTASLSGVTAEAIEAWVTVAPIDPMRSGDYTLSDEPVLTIAANTTSSTGTVTITARDNDVHGGDKQAWVGATVSGGNGVADPEQVKLTIDDDEDPPVVRLELSSNPIGESGGMSRVSATLSYATDTDLALEVTAQPQRPASGTYFTQAGGQLTVAAGETASTGTVTITAVDDDVDTPDKLVRVAAAVSGDFTAPEPVVLTIEDGDPPPVMTLAATPGQIREDGGVARITAHLNYASSEATTATITVTPVDPAQSGDFELSANRVLTLAPRTTVSTGEVTITARDNTTHAPAKHLTVSATVGGDSNVAAPPDVDVRIDDDEAVPVVSLTLAPWVIDEDDDGSTVTAELGWPSAAVTTLTIDAQPLDPPQGDYFTLSDNKVLTIAAGDTASSGIVTVAPIDDDVQGPHRSLVRITGTAVNELGVTGPLPAQLRIEDDETKQPLQGTAAVVLLLTPEEIIENGGESSVTAQLARRYQQQVVLNVTAAPHTPPTGDYFVLHGSRLTIAPRERDSTGDVRVAAVDDGTAGPEVRIVSVAATVSSAIDLPAPAARRLTIVDDEAPPKVTLVLAPAVIAEHDGVSAVTARLNHPTNVDLTMTVKTRPLGAAQADDYELSEQNTLTIAALVTESTGTVTITPVDNTVHEPSKFVEVTAPVAADSGVTGPDPRNLEIVDNEDPPTVTLLVAPNRIAENGGSATVTASLDRASSVDTVVTVTAVAEYPDTGGYFGQPRHALTIAARQLQSTGEVVITARDDTVDGPETKRVRITGDAVNQNGVIGPRALTLRIDDNDDLPEAALVLSREEIAENGGESIVSARLNHASFHETVLTVHASPQDPPRGDYFEKIGAALTIAAARTMSTGEVIVRARNDLTDSDDKEVRVWARSYGRSGVAAPADRTLKITDDDGLPGVTLTLVPGAILEGETSTVKASLTNPSSEATVVTVTAQPVDPATAADYELSPGTNLTIASGETASTGVVTITANDDPALGTTKQVRVTGTVSGGRGVQPPAARTLRILDNDGTPVVRLGLDPAEISENGGVSAVTASLTSTSSTDTVVAVTVTPEDPDAALYALSPARSLTIPAGSLASSGTATVTAVDNAVHGPRFVELEVAGTVTGFVGIAAPQPRTLKLLDDEAPPQVSLELNPAEISEKDGTSTVSATLGGASSAPTTVRVRASGVVPAGDGFFTVSPNKVLTIDAGATASTGTVTIDARDDDRYGPERKRVRVTGEASNVHGVVAPGAGELVIVDDETKPTVTLLLSATSISENGGTATVEARLSAASSTEVVLKVAVEPDAPATADDAGLVGNDVLRIAAGGTTSSGVVTILAKDNTVDAPDKSVQVTATVQSGGLAAPPPRPLTIADDEDPPEVTLALNPARIGELDGTSTVTATLDHPSSAATTLTISAAAQVPSSGPFFTQSGGLLTIAANETESTGAVTVAAVDDDDDDGGKQVLVSGTAENEQGVSGPESRTLYIDDDEREPAVTLALNPGSILEGGESLVTATLGHGSSERIVLDVTAAAFTPSTGDYFRTEGRWLTIAPGAAESTGRVAIVANDDDVYQQKKVRVSAIVAAGDAVAPAPVFLDITEELGPPSVTLVLTPASIRENEAGSDVTAVLAYAYEADTILNVTASAHDPPAGDYFTQNGDYLTIAASATASTGTVTIVPENDEVDAPDRTVRVAAAVEAGAVTAPAAVDLKIEEDETTPALTLVLSERSVLENEPPVTVTAVLSWASSEDTTLTVTASAHDPAEGDYFEQDGDYLTIAARTTSSTGIVTVGPTDDQVRGPDRTVRVAAAVTGGRGVAAPDAVDLRILDNEGVPSLVLDLSETRIEENGGTSTLTPRLDHASSEDVTFTITIGVPERRGTPAAELTLDGAVAQTIDAQALAGTALTITSVDDDVDEPDVVVVISGQVTDGDAQSPASRELTVVDDDDPPTVTLALADSSVVEGESTTVTATLDSRSSHETTVSLSVVPVAPAVAGDASLGDPAVLTIAAGGTASSGSVTITARDNGVYTPTTRTVNVRGTASNDHGVGHPADVPLAITDNDAAPAFPDDDVERSVAENTPPNQPIGDPVAAADADGDTLTYRLAEEDRELFLIDADTGQLRTLAALDYEERETYRITVEASDEFGNVGSVTVTVTVTDVAEPPEAPSPPTVTAASLTSVHATWTPPVNTGPSIDDYDYRYRVHDPPGPWTEVTEEGAFLTLETTIVSLESDTEYDVQVRATNDEGTSPWSESGTGMTDANASPIFTPESATFMVEENLTSVGTVAATDSDPEDTVLRYAITGGGDRERFVLDQQSGVLAFVSAPNWEAPADLPSDYPESRGADNEYVLVVSATSGTGPRERTTERGVMVTVIDVDEPPGPPDPEAESVSMKQIHVTWTPPANQGPPVDDYDYRYRVASGVQVAQEARAMLAALADAPVAFRVGRVAAAVDARNEPPAWTEVLDTQIEVLEVMIEDLAPGTGYEIQVRAHNAEGHGPWSESAMSGTPEPPPPPPRPPRPPVVREPINTPPRFMTSELSVEENETEVGAVLAEDDDSQDSVNGYKIVGGVDRDHFTLDRDTGALRFVDPPNYEDPRDEDAGNDYLLVVKASSGEGDRLRETEQEIVVHVTDVDEPPAAPDAPQVTEIVCRTELHVQWTEPENRGPPIVDYDYRYRVQQPPGRWTEVTDSPIDALETTIADLAPGTGYDVQVRASNDEGTGPWSDSGTAMTCDPVTPWNHVVIPWLARFTRTVAGHVMTGVEQRFEDAAAADSQVTLLGHRLRGHQPAADGTEPDPAFSFEPAQVTPLEFLELYAGSSFNLAAPGDAGAVAADPGDAWRWGVWGRGDWSRFTGSEPEEQLELGGSVVTGTLGADYRNDRVLVGLALAYSTGSGSFRVDPGETAAEVESGDLSGTLFSVHPYVHLALRDRLAVWGALGVGGLGELGVDPESEPAIAANVGMLFGAFGAQGVLLPADAAGGFELTARTDALLLTARADDDHGLIRATADVVRLRLMLEAGVQGVSLLGGSFVPTLELGVRYDDGDAERGAGLSLGGTLGYSHPAWGLSITANGQGLLTHHEAGFREWSLGGSLRFDPGAAGRGLAVSLAPTWGSASTDARGLWAAPDASLLAPADVPRSSHVPVRLDSRVSYGVAMSAEGTFTPYVGFSGTPLDGGADTWHLGGHVRLDSGISVSVEGTRQERQPESAEYTLSFAGSMGY